MQNKWIEIRDEGTFIPALAVQIDGTDGYLARRAGFGEQPCIQLIHFASGRSNYDPYDWGNRTMQGAHIHIVENWNTLRDGDVVDVAFLLGLRPAPVESEARGDAL